MRPKRITDNQSFEIKVVVLLKKRVSISARNSSDRQSDASIEDQIRICTDMAKAKKWKIVNCYTDAGISGTGVMKI